jgi:hypothetical protein
MHLMISLTILVFGVDKLHGISTMGIYIYIYIYIHIHPTVSIPIYTCCTLFHPLPLHTYPQKT